MQKAAKYYQLLLEHRDPNVVEGAETLEACIFLAHYSKDKGEFQKAKELCVRLMDYPGQGQEEAKIVLRSLRAIELHQDLYSPSTNANEKFSQDRLQSQQKFTECSGNTSSQRLDHGSRRSSGEGFGRSSLISPMPSRNLLRTPTYSRNTHVHDDEDEDDVN